jgi:hypothetical protein
MADDKPRPLNYSTLPLGARRPPPKRPLVMLVGTWLICGHVLVFAFIGILLNVSNVFRPGARYSVGDSQYSPISDGMAADVIRLFLCLGLAILMSLMLIKSLRTFRSRRKQI